MLAFKLNFKCCFDNGSSGNGADGLRVPPAVGTETKELCDI